ncbi:MAG TPA: acetyltransferase [Pyrinomonadaceae bacterium]|nr:acetyltransferase [Pyrinomonadaceae bacterium]
MDRKLVIWGASGHASVVADIVRLQGDYELVGLLDDFAPERRGTEFNGVQILGGSEQLDQLKGKGVSHLIMGFGNCAARLMNSEMAREKGFLLATAVHPKAVVAGNVRVSPGTVIAAGAIVNPGAKIGENVIINTGATVDHDCFIDDGAHLSPGTHLAGSVTIGRSAWLGIGAIVIGGLRIGANSIIGAGSVVVKDIPENVVAYGVPAKVVRGI